MCSSADGDVLEDTEDVRGQIQERFGMKHFPIHNMGPTMRVHARPGHHRPVFYGRVPLILLPGKFIDEMLNVFQAGAAYRAGSRGLLNLFESYSAGFHGFLNHSVCDGHAVAYCFVKIHIMSLRFWFTDRMPENQGNIQNRAARIRGPPCFFVLVVAVFAHIKCGIEGVEVFGVQPILGEAHCFAEALEMNYLTLS